jgi:hypothetical protein
MDIPQQEITRTSTTMLRIGCWLFLLGVVSFLGLLIEGLVSGDRHFTAVIAGQSAMMLGLLVLTWRIRIELKRRSTQRRSADLAR